MDDNEEIKVYLIFRIHTKDECFDPNNRASYFGWTTLKKVLKAFLQQRSKEKYNYTVKLYDNIKYKIDNISGIEYLDDRYMINFIKLRSSKSDGEYTFLTTASELQETEKRIQKMMKDKASLESIPGIKNSGIKILELFINLKPKYANILYYLGYRPKDFESLFPDSESYDNDVDQAIDDAYDGFAEFSQEECNYIPEPPGLSTLEDISNKILYSIEAFIKVLREDL